LEESHFSPIEDTSSRYFSWEAEKPHEKDPSQNSRQPRPKVELGTSRLKFKAV